MVVTAPVRPSRITKNPAPKGDTIIGSTTERENSMATAASTALPPAASTCAPVAVAMGWFETTIAFDATTGPLCSFIEPPSGHERPTRPRSGRARRPGAGRLHDRAEFLDGHARHRVDDAAARVVGERHGEAELYATPARGDPTPHRGQRVLAPGQPEPAALLAPHQDRPATLPGRDQAPSRPPAGDRVGGTVTAGPPYLPPRIPPHHDAEQRRDRRRPLHAPAEGAAQGEGRGAGATPGSSQRRAGQAASEDDQERAQPSREDHPAQPAAEQPPQLVVVHPAQAEARPSGDPPQAPGEAGAHHRLRRSVPVHLCLAERATAESADVRLECGSRLFGGWRSSVARTVRDREAPGSNPGPPTTFRIQQGLSGGSICRPLRADSRPNEYDR